MKRYLSVALLALIATTMMAQQRFYTSDGRTIKGYVVTMTDDLFIYSHAKDLAMPFDTLPITDVYSILYENGSFEIVSPVGIVPDKGSIVSAPKGLIQYDGEKIVSYNGKTISESEWLALASSAGLEETYSRGKTLRRVGMPLWATGVGCIAIGGIAMVAGTQNKNSMCTVIGESIALFGAPFVLVGVPLHCTGSALKKKCYQSFNQSVTSYSNVPTLNLQSSENGIGIAMHF